MGFRNSRGSFKGTDLWLKTNYTGTQSFNGNSAAVGGSGGAGIDFGNFRFRAVSIVDEYGPVIMKKRYAALAVGVC